jgi:hypothetical protein
MLLGKPSPPSRRPQRTGYKSSTIRNFDGGWNVIDNELTLDPRYARVFDNLQRAPDGSVTVRPGYKTWLDLQPLPTTTISLTANTVYIHTYAAFPRHVDIILPNHGLTITDHVVFEGFVGTAEIGPDDLNASHDIAYVTDANTFGIAVPTAALLDADGPWENGATIRKHANAVGGIGVAATYFQDHLIVVMSTGEILKITEDGVATRIWSNSDAYLLTGNPAGWTATTLVSFHNNGGSLLVHNDVDKPLDIDLTRTPNVTFLGDPASGGSNAAVPLGYLGFTSGGYAVIAGAASDPSLLQFSASLAPGVYSGNAAPDDATDIDLSKILSVPDPDIMALTELRDKLLVIFRNTTAIGVLGGTKTVGAATIHDPDFKDSIPQHGTISHRTVVPLGNDVFMCDRAGVPSIAQSQITSTFIPDRVSDLIEPAIQKNINRLSDVTLQQKAFAVYNAQERQYMLFLPKYDDDDWRQLEADPIIFTSLTDQGKFIVRVVAHGFDEGDNLEVWGALAVGANGGINGIWPISEVIDEDYIVINTGATYTDRDQIGGGSDVWVRPINEETVGYVYTYNTKLKIKAWSRYRNLNFDYGVKTPSGTIFFGKGGKLYQFGNRNNPITTDDGAAISFTWEWPWGDFDKRVNVKELFAIYPDTLGKAQFDLSVFVDFMYRDRVGVLQPARNVTFTASEVGGFGAGTQPFGGGRNTKTQYVWPVPVLGKLFKPRISGSTIESLRFVALTILYKEGTVGR